MSDHKRGLESLVLTSSIILSGCNVIDRITEDKKEIELRKGGYNPAHVDSCGPVSLKNLLEKFDISIETKDISKDILKNNEIRNITRTILGLINNEAMRITFHEEINKILKKYFNKENYEIIIKTGNNKELKSILKKSMEQDKNGIVLVKKENNPFTYHYIDFPNLVNPLNYYNEKTVVCKIYLVEEKLNSIVGRLIKSSNDFSRFLDMIYKKYYHASFPEFSLYQGK